MPRTQTNDSSPGPALNIVRLALKSSITASQLLFRNQETTEALIVTNMDIVHRSAESGATCAIGINGSTPAIFGALTGAGSYDTFSWRGYFGLAPNDYISCLVVTGTWDFNAHGYYVPYVYAFPES